MIVKTGRQLDTRAPSSGSGSGLTTQQVVVVEQNTGVQTNVKEGYKEITWTSGLPSKKEVWSDSNKTVKLWTITPTFVGGVPTQITKVNEDDGITTTTSISWTNGVPTAIEIVQ